MGELDEERLYGTSMKLYEKDLVMVAFSWISSDFGSKLSGGSFPAEMSAYYSKISIKGETS